MTTRVEKRIREFSHISSARLACEVDLHDGFVIGSRMETSYEVILPAGEYRPRHGEVSVQVQAMDLRKSDRVLRIKGQIYPDGIEVRSVNVNGDPGWVWVWVTGSMPYRIQPTDWVKITSWKENEAATNGQA